MIRSINYPAASGYANRWGDGTCPTSTGTISLSRGINLVERIVGHVAVGVDGLGGAAVADQRIDREKPPQAGVVEARVVVIEADGIEALLAAVAAVAQGVLMLRAWAVVSAAPQPAL